MKRVGVDEIADGLYGLPLGEFTQARDAAARAAADPATSKAVKSLRKPTAAAHAVNLLVRAHPGEVGELLALGERLRTAMSAGGSSDVRELTEQRRSLVSRLVRDDVPAAVRADVVASLEAATADPDIAEQVRSGRLTRPLSYAGFGAIAPSPSPRSTAAKTPAPEALDDARRRVLELAGTADDAQRRYEAAVRAAAEARQLLDAAEAERAEAHREAKAAHAEAEKARRELGRLERS
ncbi:MAG: hypothetical protein QOD07_512 [Frankiaceae bacterium]|jgi:hypothetical protein|nr:hypothetical protein [Frankiaceae bacterium]